MHYVYRNAPNILVLFIFYLFLQRTFQFVSFYPMPCLLFHFQSTNDVHLITGNAHNFLEDNYNDISVYFRRSEISKAKVFSLSFVHAIYQY